MRRPVYRLPGKTKRNKRNARPDWNALWQQTVAVYDAAELPRMKAVLKNHESDKERILRALGIISDADVLRVKKQLEKKG